MSSVIRPVQWLGSGFGFVGSATFWFLGSTRKYGYPNLRGPKYQPIQTQIKIVNK